MDKFTRSDIEEAKRTTAWLLTKQPQPLKWIIDPKTQKRVMPCAWYAISVLAPKNGITAGHRQAFMAMDRRWCAFVVARKGSGPLQRAQIGAASSKDRRFALCFAYRNAIRQLLPQQANEVGWRDTKTNAAQKYT